MKNLLIFTLFLPTLLILTGCGDKPSPHPSKPHYEIIKPKVKYKPTQTNLSKMVKQLQGKPYVWAEEGPNTFDCSGFTYYMYGRMGIEIPRTAREQAKVGKRVKLKDLQYGDLIFFATNRHHRHRITHVGMYLGNGWFTHASTVKNEVVYSNLFKSKYYKNRLRLCRRYLPQTRSHVAVKESAKPPVLKRAQKAIQKNIFVAKKKQKPIMKKVVVKKIKDKNITKSISSSKEVKIASIFKAVKTKKSVTQKDNNITKKKKAIVIQTPIHEIEKKSNIRTFYIQAGAFVGEPDQHILNKILRNGLHYELIQYPKNNQVISKLLIGPYPNRKQAKLSFRKVKRAIASHAFIVEIR